MNGTSRTLKPGLYRATVRGVPDQVVFVDSAGYGRTEDYVDGDYREHWVRDHITDARQLIVLDLEEPQWRTYVVEVLREARHSWTNAVADQIEAQTKPPPPPRIAEPGLWGVVEAGLQGYARSTFVRVEPTLTASNAIGPAHWQSRGGVLVNWHELVDPTLTRAGFGDPS